MCPNILYFSAIFNCKLLNDKQGISFRTKIKKKSWNLPNHLQLMDVLIQYCNHNILSLLLSPPEACPTQSSSKHPPPSNIGKNYLSSVLLALKLKPGKNSNSNQTIMQKLLSPSNRMGCFASLPYASGRAQTSITVAFLVSWFKGTKGSDVELHRKPTLQARQALNNLTWNTVQCFPGKERATLEKT